VSRGSIFRFEGKTKGETFQARCGRGPAHAPFRLSSGQHVHHRLAFRMHLPHNGFGQNERLFEDLHHDAHHKFHRRHRIIMGDNLPQLAAGNGRAGFFGGRRLRPTDVDERLHRSG